MACVISCTICSEFYKVTDDVYSTSCGHIYHFHCMKQWQSRFTSCPQCRTFQPTTHKIFLNFEDNADAEKQILELKEEANVSNVMRTLHEEQLLKNEEQIKLLKDQVTYFKIVNEGRAREIKVKDNQISALMELQTISTQGGKPAALLAKLNDLEERFQMVFLELTKEITRSIDKTLEKTRLQSIMEKTPILKIDPTPVITPKVKSVPSTTTAATPPTPPTAKPPTPSVAKPPTPSVAKPPAPPVAKPPASPANVQSKPNPNAVGRVTHAVVIKGIPREELENLGAPRDVVWMLGQHMGLLVKDEYIEKAFILKGKFYNNFSKKVALVVEFKTMPVKLKFTNNCDRLQDYEEWETVTVSQYMSAETSALLYHAQLLLDVGFTDVYHENDRVYAKQWYRAQHPMLITSREQVDALLAEYEYYSD